MTITQITTAPTENETIGKINELVTGVNASQTTSNLVTSVSSASTDAQYPSAKLFYDTVGDIETALQTINSGGS